MKKILCLLLLLALPAIICLAPPARAEETLFEKQREQCEKIYPAMHTACQVIVTRTRNKEGKEIITRYFPTACIGVPVGSLEEYVDYCMKGPGWSSPDNFPNVKVSPAPVLILTPQQR